MRARSTAGVSAQAAEAALAASMTEAVSSAVAKGTRAMGRPVEGLKTSPLRVEVLFVHLPPENEGTTLRSATTGMETGS